MGIHRVEKRYPVSHQIAFLIDYKDIDLMNKLDLPILKLNTWLEHTALPPYS